MAVTTAYTKNLTVPLLAVSQLPAPPTQLFVAIEHVDACAVVGAQNATAIVAATAARPSPSSTAPRRFSRLHLGNTGARVSLG
jgi:hypothetical protein